MLPARQAARQVARLGATHRELRFGHTGRLPDCRWGILGGNGKMAAEGEAAHYFMPSLKVERRRLRQLRAMTGKLPDGGDGADHGQHIHEHRPDDPMRNSDLQAGNIRPQLGPQLRDLGLQEDKLGQRLGGAGCLLVW